MAAKGPAPLMVGALALIAVTSMRPPRSSPTPPAEPSSPVAARAAPRGTANGATGPLPADRCTVVDFFGRPSEDRLEHSSVIRSLPHPSPPHVHFTPAPI